MALPTYSLNNPGVPKYSFPSAPDAPVATGGKQQSRSPRGPKVKKSKPSPVKSAPKAPALDPTTKALLDAAVKLRFGGQEQALGQQLQSSARFASGVPTWYSQAIANIKAQQTPVGPVQAPTPTGDPAADSRANLNAAFAQQVAQRQGAENDFLTNVGAGLQVQQGNVLNANAQQQNQIRQQQTQLAGDKGAFKTTTLADMQAEQAKAAQEQAKIQASLAIADGKLGLARDILNNVTKPKTTAEIKSKRSAARAQKINAQANQQRAADAHAKAQRDANFFAKHGYYPSSSSPKITAKAKQITDQRKENAKLADQTSRGAAVLRQYVATLKGKSVPSRQTLIDMLETSKHGISHVAAVRAVNKVLRDLPSPGAGLGGPYGNGTMSP